MEVISMEFKKLTLEDKSVFDKYYEKFPQVSSFLSFTTLYLWKKYSGIEYAVSESGDIVLKGISGKTGNSYFCLPETDEKTFLLLLDELKREYREVNLINLTEAQTEMVKKAYPDATVEYKENNGNYVYKTSSLATLSGKKLQSKRNHLNGFKNSYEYEIREIDEKIVDECISLTEEWFDSKTVEEGYLEAETEVCSEALKLRKELGLKGIAIVCDSKVIAYSVGEYMNNGKMAHIIIEKADSDYRGAFNAINNFFINECWLDTEYVNREEDMGVEGLRKAKLSYRPAFLLKMYNVRI